MQSTSRRSFLKQVGMATAGLTVCAKAPAVHATPVRADRSGPNPDPCGVLVDTTRCVGCRRCEKAWNEINTALPRREANFFQD